MILPTETSAAAAPARSRFWWDSAKTSMAAALGQAPSVLVAPVAAFAFGASDATDAVFLALSAALFVVTTLSGATQFAAIPFLIEFRARHGRSVALVHTLIRAATTFSGAAVAVLALTATGYAWTLDRQYVHVATYLWLLGPFTVTASVVTVLSGALTSVRQYVVPAFSPIWRWGTVLLCVLLAGGWFGPVVLIFAYTVGEAIRLLLLLTFVRRHFHTVILTGEQRAEIHEGRRPLLKAALAQITGSAVLACVPIIDRIMATSLPPGSVSILEYADRLWQVPVGLAASGFLVVLLADWSDDAQRSLDRSRIAAKTMRVAFQIGVCSLVPALVIFSQRHSLIQGLFGRSDLTSAELRALADTFGFYILGIPTYVAGLTYARAFLALKRPDWLIVVAAVEVALKLAINPLLMHRFGVPGLAAASSLMYAAALVLLATRLPGVVRVNASA